MKWHRHLDSHPLFRKLTKEEQEEDPVVEKLWESTEEGQKVLGQNLKNLQIESFVLM